MLHPTYCSTPGRMGLQVPAGDVASLPGIWEHLGFPAWLGDGSLREEGPGAGPLQPHSAGVGLILIVCSSETGPVWFKCLK